MKQIALSIFALTLISIRLTHAQSSRSDYQYISTGTVTARINSSGALVNSMFLNSDSSFNLLPEFSLWLGAVGHAGNLMLNIQQADTMANDFVGGFIGIPNSAGVWKVTKKDIYRHWQDFLEDGDIDNPIPSIFSWPASGNPFSMQYNGLQPILLVILPVRLLLVMAIRMTLPTEMLPIISPK